MKRSLLITLEGGEGAGKSTLIQSLELKFQELGRRVVITREPGGCPLGEAVRSLLLESERAVDSRAELLLFLAARSQHVSEVIEPALERGDVVLCDRFTHSTLAYQGYGRGFDLKELSQMCAFAAHGLKPSLTLYLDVPVSVGMARIGERASDRMESEKGAFHEAVHKGFLELSREPNVALIDARLSPEAVAEKAWSQVVSLL